MILEKRLERTWFSIYSTRRLESIQQCHYWNCLLFFYIPVKSVGQNEHVTRAGRDEFKRETSERETPVLIWESFSYHFKWQTFFKHRKNNNLAAVTKRKKSNRPIVSSLQHRSRRGTSKIISAANERIRRSYKVGWPMFAPGRGHVTALKCRRILLFTNVCVIFRWGGGAWELRQRTGLAYSCAYRSSDMESSFFSLGRIYYLKLNTFSLKKKQKMGDVYPDG